MAASGQNKSEMSDFCQPTSLSLGKNQIIASKNRPVLDKIMHSNEISLYADFDWIAFEMQFSICI